MGMRALILFAALLSCSQSASGAYEWEPLLPAPELHIFHFALGPGTTWSLVVLRHPSAEKWTSDDAGLTWRTQMMDLPPQRDGTPTSF